MLVDYRLRQTNGEWKIIDVVIEGVSLVANYRTEFNSTVREVGIEGLIRNLHAKNGSLEAAPPAENK